MDFKQIEAYVKVYELKSFSKAAEEIFLSQPSVSAYISSLEKELHAQLIYRSTKEFLPTREGKIFYEHAKDLLALRDKSVFSVKNASDCSNGTIDILASTVPSQYILPEILAAFHKPYPGISFRLEQADTAEVVKGIAAHKSEVGFVGAKIDNAKCVYDDFVEEKLIIIAPFEKRFKNISSGDIPSLLYREYFIEREAGSGTRLRYEEFLKELGVKPEKLKICARLGNTQSIIHSVACGLGISIVSELAARRYIDKEMIITLPVGRPLPERKLYIVTKKNYAVSPIVNNFINFARSYMPRLGRE